MTDKLAPLGICDLCGDQIPDDPYTSKGRPRLYCSIDCRNTANSRAGASERGRKAKDRVAAGTWINPNIIHPPTSEEQAARARKGRLREVNANAWRNPALGDDARAKLSRPRVHIDDEVLHSAIEKLTAGASVKDLTPAEAEAHRAYRRRLADARRAELNAAARARYNEQQQTMTDEEREAQREKWREANRRRARKTE